MIQARLSILIQSLSFQWSFTRARWRCVWRCYVRIRFSPQPCQRSSAWEININGEQSPAATSCSRSLMPTPRQTVPQAVKHQDGFIYGLDMPFLIPLTVSYPHSSKGKILELPTALSWVLSSFPGVRTNLTAETGVGSLPLRMRSRTGTSTSPGCSWKNTR